MSLTDLSPSTYKDDAATCAGAADVQTPVTEPSQGFSGAADSTNAADINIEVHDFKVDVPYLDFNIDLLHELST